MVTAYGYVGTYATPPHPYDHICPQDARSHGKLRSMLTGTGVGSTGVGSNFRFVVHLELKPAYNLLYRLPSP